MVAEQQLSEERLALNLAALGYPGLPRLSVSPKKRTSIELLPTKLLLNALSMADLDIRLIEALPWLVWRFSDLNWEDVIAFAQDKGLQNKLGFVVSLARRLAQERDELKKAERLRVIEMQLEKVRVTQEDTLCHDSLTNTERRWLRTHRTPDAKRWRILTDLSPAHLHHVE